MFQAYTKYYARAYKGYGYIDKEEYGGEETVQLMKDWLNDKMWGHVIKEDK